MNKFFHLMTSLPFDTQADVKKKIRQAYCPPQEVAGNPCIEYVQYVVLPWFKEFEIQRDASNGGNKYVFLTSVPLLSLLDKSNTGAPRT